jgi:hypothetical protein
MNLKAIAKAKGYRLTWDESRAGREQDANLMQIPCKHGHIYPHGPKTLGAAVDGHPGIVRKLLALPGTRCHQLGDRGEANILFGVELLDTVAGVMRVRRRRRMTDAQRAAATERLSRC